MKSSSLLPWCLGIGLGAVVTFSLMTIIRARELANRPGMRTAEPPTAEQAALNNTYLTQYSRKKFAPLLAILPKSMSPDQVRRLSEILAEREIRVANAKPKADQASMTMSAYLEAQERLISQKLFFEFGQDVVDRVEHYIRTLPQRLMIGEINQILVYRGISLTAEQIEKLCDAINSRDLMIPRHPTADDMTVFISSKEAANNQVTVAAKAFLSPEQLTVLTDELALQLAQLRVNREGIRRAANLRP